MKRLLYFIIFATLLVFCLESKAEQQCNPDYNVVMTGVPYCNESADTSATTSDPNSINNAIDEDAQNENDTNSPQIIIDPFRYQQPIIPRPYPPPIYYRNPDQNYRPNQGNQYNPNVQSNNYQYVPNTPLDNLPIEIPHSR